MELNDLVVHGTDILRAITRGQEPWSLSERYDVTCYGETVAIEAAGSRKNGVDTGGVADALSHGLAELPPPDAGAAAILQLISLLLCNDHFIAWYSRDRSLPAMLGRVIDCGLVRWKKCLSLDATEGAVSPLALDGPLQVARLSDIPNLPSLPTVAVYHDLAFADLDAVLGQVRHHRRMVFFFTDAAVGSSFVAAVQAAKPDLSFHAAPVDQPGGTPLYVGYAC